MPTSPPPDPRPAPPPEPQAPEPTLGELIACAEREVRQRRRVYPRLIERGTMAREEAERELRLMKAILTKLLDEAQPPLL